MSLLPISNRIVVDTNVVFEGLTKQGGASGLVIDSWLAGIIEVCVSNPLAYEYVDVLSRKLSAKRWQRIKPILGSLLDRTEFISVYFTWRPSSPDPGDEHVIDCAMNANATVVTFNLRDFQPAARALGLRTMTPDAFIYELVD